MVAPALSVSVVTFYSDLADLRAALSSLLRAVSYSTVSNATVFIIDNSHSDMVHRQLHECIQSVFADSLVPFQLIDAGSNIGYGQANNLVLPMLESDYHLILNPDVVLDSEAIREAIGFLEEDPAVAMVAPSCVDVKGESEHLCKQYPSIADFLLRGFAPGWIRSIFSDRLSIYERHDLVKKKIASNVLLASGCFMFVRTRELLRVNGFSPDFFMYFEDYDFSIRIRECGRIAYVSSVKIVHGGGNTAEKGIKHIRMFCRSAVRFFNLHGWRIW